MTRLNLALATVCLAVAIGCADAPSRLDELTRANPGLVAGMGSLSHDEWSSGSPGCEDADFGSLALSICEDEPALGALVTDDGEVVCVDSLDVLIEELLDRTENGIVTADPSPQPSHPGHPHAGAPMDSAMRPSMRRPPVYTQSTGGTRADPTPTPVIQADPTPTPVTNPTFDTIPPALLGRDPAEEDPTPTPTTDP